MNYKGWLVGVVLLFGCVSAPPLPMTEEEGTTVQLSYGRAFDQIIQLLESRDYTIALADKQAGIIETHPKRVSGEEGKVHHQSLLSFLLRGDRNQTTVYLRVIVTSDYPDEQKKIIESLKSLSP